MENPEMIILNLPQLDRIESEIKEIKKEFNDNKKINQKWYNLKTACTLKGCSYNTVKSNSKYQPLGGRPDAKMHGVKVWTHEHIEEWLNVHDGNREDYLKKYETTQDAK